MLPDLDSLALFVRAAELRSLTKAADASHLGLAAASRRMALLEHRFKATLFERSSRGVELTPAGVALLPYAKSLLIEINQMNAVMSDHAAGHKGALRVLANTSVMAQALPQDLAGYGRAHPEVRLVIEERWSSEILRALLAAEADIGIVVEGLATDGLEVYGYRHDRLAIVVRPEHALAAGGDLAFADMIDEDLVALESTASMMRLLTSQAAILQKALKLRVQVRSFEAVCRMVEAGLGVGLLPLQAARPLGAAMGLVVHPLADEWAERRMLICVKRDRPPNSSLSKLIAHLTRDLP